MQFPIKTLHVTGQLEHGGISSWLRTLMLTRDPQQLSADICCNYRQTSGILTDEFKKFGCSVYHIPLGLNLFRYQQKLTALFNRNHYDIIHDHRSFLSGATVRAAYKAGIPVRITHHHTSNDAILPDFVRKAYYKILKSWALKYSTNIWGCSISTVAALYGDAWHDKDPRLAVFYPGFSLSLPSTNARPQVRSQFGIPETHKVVGFICKMARPKNPFLALDVCLRVLDRMKYASVLWVGDGPLLPAIKERAHSHHCNSRIHFAGAPNDIADIYAAIDLFYIPSIWEGLPLAILEALQAGLPVVGSRAPGVLEALPPDAHKNCFEFDDANGQEQAILRILSLPPTRNVPADFLKPFLAPQMYSRLIAAYVKALEKEMPS